MSSEERKPKPTLPMQEAIGCEMFMVIYDFHIMYEEIQWRCPLTAVGPLSSQKVSVDIRIKVLPSIYSSSSGSAIY